uniref:Spen paralogue and orthologue SPOC C-terminal domain-containing protein n=1 Tax=Oryza barthii TaxID=65489 RepID=A0A0D3G0V4_9ORYZ
MSGQSNSPDMIFQVYTPRKRKFLNSVHYSESNRAVSHGSGLVTSAKDSHQGEESFLNGPAGLSSILSNSQGFAPQDILSGTTELSGIRCTTSSCKPNETILHTISTNNGTSNCQDTTQSFSLLMECTNHTTPSKPMHPHITFQLMHTKIESSNSCAKYADSTDQSQTAVAHKLLFSCEKGDQSIVAMVHPSQISLEKIQQKQGISSYEAKHDVQGSTKADDSSSILSPHSLDDEIMSVVGLLSPSAYESLCDGTIQLSSTVKVSVIAFFKSGEKNHDITWPKIIEIKGRVKLDAFEKFVQELRRCQTRSLLVISLCWKFGTSKAGLLGMKEVAENFEASQKVGFADVCDGSNLYVCPRSDAVITILAKCGFFKGMSAADTNQDSLIGCIVWRRNPLSKIVDHSRSETIGKGSPCVPHVGARHPTSLPFSDGHQATSCSNNPGMDSRTNTGNIQNDIDQMQEIQSNSVKTHPVATGLLSQCGHAKSTGERDPTEKVVPHSLFKLASKLTPQPPFKAPSLIGCQLSQVSPFELASHEVPEIQQHVQSIIDSHSGSFGVWHPTSHSQGLSLKSLHVQQRTTHYDLAAQKNHMAEAFSGSITQEYASNAVESSKQQETNPFLLQPDTYGAHRANDIDDLPKVDFANLHRVELKFDVHPINRETTITSDVLICPRLSDKKSNSPFQQSSQPSFRVEGIKNHEKVEVKENVTDMISREITNQVSHRKAEIENFKSKDDIDAEDMPECHFQGLDNEKLHQSGSIEVEDISSGHDPNMPSGCLNIPRDQGSFPRHPPPAQGDQRLAARHPPVLADQGYVPRLPPPVLEDQGLAPRCPPPALAGQGFVPRHPPPVLPNQGFFPRRCPPFAGQDLYPWRPPFHANQGPFPRHAPPHPCPPFTPGHVRPPSNFAPPGPWRPVLHPGQEHHHHHYGHPGRSNGPSGSGNKPGYHNPSYGNGPGGCRPPHQAQG